MDNIVINLATLVGVIIGLTQVIKMATNMPSRFAPLLDLVLGVGLSPVFISVSRDSAILGIIAGLSASGTYSGAQTVGASTQSNTPPPLVN